MDVSTRCVTRRCQTCRSGIRIMNAASRHGTQVCYAARCNHDLEIRSTTWLHGASRWHTSGRQGSRCGPEAGPETLHSHATRSLAEPNSARQQGIERAREDPSGFYASGQASSIKKNQTSRAGLERDPGNGSDDEPCCTLLSSCLQRGTLRGDPEIGPGALLGDAEKGGTTQNLAVPSSTA